MTQFRDALASAEWSTAAAPPPGYQLVETMDLAPRRRSISTASSASMATRRVVLSDCEAQLEISYNRYIEENQLVEALSPGGYIHLDRFALVLVRTGRRGPRHLLWVCLRVQEPCVCVCS